MRKLLIFGAGYSGTAIGGLALQRGWQVTGTRRHPTQGAATPFPLVAFADAEPAIAAASHIISTIPPVAGHDPVLHRYGAALNSATYLTWLGYLSTTGVYGNRDGGWVDETTTPAPSQQRGHDRLRAEQAWRHLAAQKPVDLFRVAGIYGPGRSAFDQLRAGTARLVIKPGHVFGRIHRQDIARAVLAAAEQTALTGCRVFNLNDDLPAEPAAVIAEAASLLGLTPPPSLPFAAARDGMSAMAASFWSESRRVRAEQTKQMLGITWHYPTYREGLRAILREETGQGLA